MGYEVVEIDISGPIRRSGRTHYLLIPMERMNMWDLELGDQVMAKILSVRRMSKVES